MDFTVRASYRVDTMEQNPFEIALPTPDPAVATGPSVRHQARYRVAQAAYEAECEAASLLPTHREIKAAKRAARIRLDEAVRISCEQEDREIAEAARREHTKRTETMTRTTDTPTYLNHPADWRALAEWCECRNTSVPVGLAIHHVAQRRGLDPDTVWHGAPQDAVEEIMERAWAMVDPSDGILHWGEESMSRPTEAE
jgi:hypothetical protein